MRHLILVCILSLTALPLQAQWGLSNVVTKEIHHTPGIPAAPPTPSIQDNPEPSVTKQDVQQISYTKTTNYPYTIHLSSFETPQEAIRQVQRLKDKLDMVFVTKIDLGEAGIWYRMDYGAFPTIKEAVLKLQELKAKGIVVDKGTFVGGSVPYAIEIGMYQNMKDARSKAQKLTSKGVIPYVIKEREDIYRLLAGAYPNEKSAAPAMDDLMAMNLLPTLKKR
jgi:cell division septation protein DedD